MFGVKDIAREHWARFGRNYYVRHDYESCEDDKAKAFMKATEAKMQGFEGKANVFSYSDPVDLSFTNNQGLRFYRGNWRVVFRISGTGTVGSTVRIYYEKFEKDQIDLDMQAGLQDVVDWTRAYFNVHEMLDRQNPDVIT